MKQAMEKLEGLLELGGTKKDITLLAISAAAVICSLLKLQPLPFDIAWIAIILCGVPIILEAVIGLVTAFDIKADVLVLGAGIYYLAKEKHDPESKKIYTVVSVIGGVVAIVCAVLLVVA